MEYLYTYYTLNYSIILELYTLLPGRNHSTHLEMNKGKISLIIPGDWFWLMHKRGPAWNEKFLPVFIGPRLIHSTYIIILKSLLNPGPG